MNLRLWWTSARKWERECDYNHSVWCSKCSKCVKPHILCLNHIVTHTLWSPCISWKGVMECLTKYLINQIDVLMASETVWSSDFEHLTKFEITNIYISGRFKIMRYRWIFSGWFLTVVVVFCTSEIPWWPWYWWNLLNVGANVDTNVKR